MKRFIVSASVMAVSAASLHAIYAPELGRLESGKPWTVSASLRGFYDDNWAGVANNVPATKRDSFGMEIRPYVGVNFPMEQTFVGFSYLNSSSWYESRSRLYNSDWDFAHEATLKFDHAFSPRYRIGLRDSFLYGQEPDTTTTGTTAFARRLNSSYLRNVAAFNFFGQLTRQFGLSINYNNTYWDFEENGNGSYSALLDRMEHLIPLALHWQMKPDVVMLLGYSLGIQNYTGDSYLDSGFNPLDAVGSMINGHFPYRSEDRDSISHSFYLGVDYDMTAQLKFSLRGGAQYTTYQNTRNSDQLTPYADCSLNYTYLPGSHVDLGFKHSMNATDMAAADGRRATLDQEISAIYLNVDHKFTGKFSANVLAQYQIGKYHGGISDGRGDDFLLLGLYLNYKLNPFLALEAGYNFDLLSSDYNLSGTDYRSFDRNRVFLGLRASY
jgi:hypothetical protein